MRDRDLEGFGPVGTNGPVEHPLIVRLEKLLIDAPGKLMLDDERRTVQEAIAALRALRDAQECGVVRVGGALALSHYCDERKYTEGQRVRLVVVGDGNG